MSGGVPFAPALRGPGSAGRGGGDDPPLVPLPEHAAALAALRSLAAAEHGGDDDPAPPPALLYGPAGCGKSRLVREFLRLDAEARGKPGPGERVHLTGAGLAASLDEGLGGGFAGPLRASLLDARTLIVEDLAGLAGRPKTQDLLVAAADAALAAGGRVLWTAPALPGEVPGLARRLADRLRGGVLAPVGMPGAASRAALLGDFADRRRVPAPPDVLKTLADGLPVSARELLAAADRLTTLARAAGSTGWTAPLAAALLEGREGTANPTLAAVSAAVAKRFGLTAARVRAAGRSAAVVPARQAGMALGRELTGEPLAAIARHFGRTDHGTVSHAMKRFEARLASDPAFRADVAAVRRALRR